MSRTGIPSAPAREDATPRAVGYWLLAVALLVTGMIVLGGATRLTQSGLSIVEWRPLSGVLPPLNEQEWEAAFARYRQFPEYQTLNRHISLDQFKTIYWFEYAHRLLGRLIGLVFLLPWLWFLARGQLRGRLAWQLGGLFVLGALQGLAGWWMVKSGLVDRPDVSQYRLAVHLALALAILGLLLHLAWRVLWPRPRIANFGRGPWLLLVLVYLQALSGALVAGLDAGLHYNTFPTMNGAWLPPELWHLTPWWLNLLENPTTVQFDHRIGAYLVAIAVLACWWRVRPTAEHSAKLALDVVLTVMLVQVGLGIATLLLQVPVGLGVLHQAGAVALFAAVLWLAEDPLRRSSTGP